MKSRVQRRVGGTRGGCVAHRYCKQVVHGPRRVWVQLQLGEVQIVDGPVKQRTAMHSRRPAASPLCPNPGVDLCDVHPKVQADPERRGTDQLFKHAPSLPQPPASNDTCTLQPVPPAPKSRCHALRRMSVFGREGSGSTRRHPGTLCVSVDRLAPLTSICWGRGGNTALVSTNLGPGRGRSGARFACIQHHTARTGFCRHVGSVGLG